MPPFPFERVTQLIPRLKAGADLSSHKHKAVKLNSSGDVILASALGETVVGVLVNDPTSGQAADVAYAGVVKMIAGATITPMNKIATSAAGLGVVATAETVNTADAGSASDAVVGGHVIGIALTPAASGEVFSLLLLHIGSVPTTAA